MIIITPYGISKDRERVRSMIKEAIKRYEWAKGQDIVITNGPPEVEDLNGEPRQFLLFTGTQYTNPLAISRLLEPLGMDIVINYLDPRSSNLITPKERKRYA